MAFLGWVAHEFMLEKQLSKVKKKNELGCIHHYGIPHSISSDQGTHFPDKKMLSEAHVDSLTTYSPILVLKLLAC